MKVTNVNGLPEVLVRAISSNWYSGAGVQRFASVTQLIKPTKITVLERRHWQEITRDASDMIWSLMGSAMHKVLEAGGDNNSLSEERVSAMVSDARITGGVDFYEDGVITDFKFIGVWSRTSAERREEWEKQLNMYAYLYRELGFEVRELRVLAIYRDWSKRRAESEANYPCQVEIIPVQLWDNDAARRFIEARVLDIRDALEHPDDLVPECSPGERWQAPDQYAVYKTGGSRALRVFDTEKEAQEYIAGHKDAEGLSLVVRQGYPKRCHDYCPVNGFCHFYRDLDRNPVQLAG